MTGVSCYIEFMKFVVVLLMTVSALPAQNLKDFEKKVTEFTLVNGMHFTLLERHEAPVVSFHTYVNAGAVDDPLGKTGLAHMFEHMAFKGTEFLGTTNWAEEKKSLAEVEKKYDQLDAERYKGPKADPDKVRLLRAELKVAMDQANSYVVPNLYPRLIEENGGVGLNASTGEDSTNYFYNLPANRIELWFLLESQRFLRPVFREFYKERDVVREERRLRVESEPQGKLIEVLGSTAFEAHPYNRGPGGWASDIENLRIGDAEQFFQKYYGPSNINIAIVGDVNPAEARRLADRYFGPISSRPLPSPVITKEPPQDGPKSAQVESPSQPIEFIAYKRPDQYDKDDPVFDVINGILSGGRTGTLYKELVRDKKISLAAGGDATYPGGKYPNLYLFFLVPSIGKTSTENEKAFYSVLDQLKNKKVDAQTLARVKIVTRAGVIRQLDSNAGLAALITATYGGYGDWRKIFISLDEIDRVTADDVQRVARQYFTEKGRTIAFLAQPAAVGAGGAK